MYKLCSLQYYLTNYYLVIWCRKTKITLKMKKITFCLLASASLFLASCATQKTVAPPPSSGVQQSVYSGPKKDVDGVTGILIFHPDSIFYTGKEGRKYSLFFDKPDACIFVTENPNLYVLFSEQLPIQMQAGKAVLLEGVTIDPVTIFRPEQMQQIANSQNMTLVELNHFKVAKIFNYGTLENSTNAVKILYDLLLKKGLAAPVVQQQSQQAPPSSAPPTEKKSNNTNGGTLL
jgi:hypothetical protein